MLTRFVERVARQTSGGRYVPEIDGIRFVAFGSVFLFHVAGDVLRRAPSSLAHPAWLSVTERLNIGVQVFFVLSGLIVALPFAQAARGRGVPVSLSRYVWRRVTRIEPPYIVTLVAFFFLKALFAQDSAVAMLPHLATSALYLHNLVYQAPSTINFVAWSLEVEIQFYLLAPMLAKIYVHPNPAIRRVMLCAVALALHFGVPHVAPWVMLSFAGQGAFFLVGMLLADLRSSAPESPSRARSIVGEASGILGLLVIGAFLTMGDRFPELAWGALPVGLGTFAWGALEGVSLRWILSRSLVSAIGGMCYSLYLLHNYEIAILGAALSRRMEGWSLSARMLFETAVLFPAVVALSTVFFLVVEKPCMDPSWPQRLRAFVTSLRTRAAVVG